MEVQERYAPRGRYGQLRGQLWVVCDVLALYSRMRLYESVHSLQRLISFGQPAEIPRQPIQRHDQHLQNVENTLYFEINTPFVPQQVYREHNKRQHDMSELPCPHAYTIPQFPLPQIRKLLLSHLLDLPIEVVL